MSELNVIENKSKLYATLLTDINTIAATIRKKIQQSTNEHLDELAKKMEEMKSIEAEIKQELIDNKDLFKKPKTRVIHCLKLGFRKGKGKLIINDVDKVIESLERNYDGAEGFLVKTTKTIIKKGVENLDGKELKRLGVTIQDADDQVVFDVVEDNIDEFLSFVFEMQS